MMIHIEQIYTNCLSQGSYYLESEGTAAVIDPLREVEIYLQKAQRNGATIRYIFETHFHADFVSGHLTLAEKTGATIIYGPTATPTFACYIAKDEETFTLGAGTIKVLHTPGHTQESVVYLLLDSRNKQKAIFSGDTLFLGDVGRPDLAQKNEMSPEQMAGILYDSLRRKILPLNDEVVVYPGHGAGSACGKNMMNATQDTLGNQKKTNYALQAHRTRNEFIEELLRGLPLPPPYFSANVQMNKEGYADISSILKRSLLPLSPQVFKEAIRPNVVLLDVRPACEFCRGHLKGSIFIGLEGAFAPWVGALLADVKVPLLLIAPKGREQEAITRLARVGFDNVIGYLDSLEGWEEARLPLETIENIQAKDLQPYEYQDSILDVRTPKEYQTKHLKGACNVPLSEIDKQTLPMGKKQEKLVYCAGGYRSVIACSLLKKKGHQGIINIAGGFKAIKENKKLILQ